MFDELVGPGNEVFHVGAIFVPTVVLPPREFAIEQAGVDGRHLGGAEPDLTSATSPAGIKIGGSYPQNTQEFNAFNGRFDDLMFFNRTLTISEVWQQYANFFASSAPVLGAQLTNQHLVLSWPETAAEFTLEQTTNLMTTVWSPSSQPRATNNGVIQVNVPLPVGSQGFFRLRKP